MYKPNIFATKMCGSENLMVHKIRYNVKHKCSSLGKHIPPYRQTAAWRYNKVGQLLQNFDHGKNKNTMINTLPRDLAILD